MTNTWNTVAQALAERNELGFDIRKQKILLVLDSPKQIIQYSKTLRRRPGAFSKRLACNY